MNLPTPDEVHPSWHADLEALTLEGVRQTIEANMAREVAAVEAACEKALVDPEGRGVKIIRYLDGMEVGLSDDVPYGEIHSYEVHGLRGQHA